MAGKRRVPDGIKKKKTIIDLSKKKNEETSWHFARKEAPHIAKPFMQKVEEDHKGDEGIIITQEINELKESAGRHARMKFGMSSVVRFGLIGGIVVFLVIFLLLSTVFARVTVTVKPRIEGIVLRDVVAVFDSSVSKVLLSQKVLPAERLEFSRNLIEEFEATGRKFIEDKARGKVKLFNSFSSLKQTLVQSTRFVNDAGIVYRLEKTVVVPGAEIDEGKIVPRFIEVDLVADVAGEQSNIPEGQKLRIPGFKGTAKYDGFYAITAVPLGGGFKGEARVVSADDLKKAQEQVTKKLYENIQNEISRKIPPNFKLIDVLREIQITKVDVPRENTRRDRFPVEAKATGKVIIFRESDVVELVKALVLKDDVTKELVSDLLGLQYKIRNIDFEKGKAETIIQGEVKVKSVIPKEDLASLIFGKKEGTIIELLKSRQELASFSVAFFPPWIFKSPKTPEKIKFVIEDL